MGKVTGIGGSFFRAQEPAILAKWYADHLGVDMTPPSYDAGPWWQQQGPTVFNPFPRATTYWPSEKQGMINFRVRDLDAW